MNKDLIIESSLPVINTHALNTPKVEAKGVPDNDNCSQCFLEHVTWFVSS